MSDVERVHSETMVPLRLVPVEVFTGLCRHQGCADPNCVGYGISDAVSAWSDCNRAVGHIYRVDDLDGSREPGDTLTVHVPESDVQWFRRSFDDDREQARLVLVDPSDPAAIELAATEYRAHWLKADPVAGTARCGGCNEWGDRNYYAQEVEADFAHHVAAAVLACLTSTDNKEQDQ